MKDPAHAWQAVAALAVSYRVDDHRIAGQLANVLGDPAVSARLRSMATEAGTLPALEASVLQAGSLLSEGWDGASIAPGVGS